MKRFPASEPRRMFWSRDVGGHRRCPECSTSLAGERHTYVLATRRHWQVETFLVGNDGGYFCAGCPTVVLDHHKFAEAASVSLGFRRDVEFVVLGLVDLEAVPREKSGIPLGSADNPPPLVRFTNLDDGGKRPGPSTESGRKHDGRRSKAERSP